MGTEPREQPYKNMMNIINKIELTNYILGHIDAETLNVELNGNGFSASIYTLNAIDLLANVEHICMEFNVSEYVIVTHKWDHLTLVVDLETPINDNVGEIENVIVENVDIDRDFMINIKCLEIDMNEHFVQLYRINPSLDIETMIFDDIRDAFLEYRIDPVQYNFTWEYDPQNGLWDGTPCQKLTINLFPRFPGKTSTSLMIVDFIDDEMRKHTISANTLLSVREWMTEIIESFDLSALDIVSVMENGKYVFRNNSPIWGMGKTWVRQKLISCSKFTHEIMI